MIGLHVILYFLALVIPACCAEQGAVLSFLPDGKYNFIYTEEENDNDPISKFWILNGNEKFVEFICNNFELNTKSPAVMSELRVQIMTKDNAELDSFRVKSCEEAALRGAIQVKQTKNEETKKEYEVIFKDDHNGCRKRTYVVDVITNEVYPFFGIDRAKVVDIPTNWRTKCPVSGEGIVIDWYDDGLIHDFELFDEYDTEFSLPCQDCFVICKLTEKGSFADIFAANIHLDRLKVSSCRKVSLQISVKFDFSIYQDIRTRGVYLDFLTTDGRCLWRKYVYDNQIHMKHLFRRSYLDRQDVRTLRGCKSMKAQGFARLIGKQAYKHAGAWGKKLLGWRGGESSDNEAPAEQEKQKS